MKITTTGSLGNVAKPLVKKLIAAGHELTVITTKEEKIAEIEALGAKAAVGSISDTAFLTQAFADADAVYTMVPPSMGASNLIQNIAEAGRAYADAIKASKVPRVVLLSSVGADAAAGTGPVGGVHLVEEAFRKLTDVNITVLRSGFFMVNFFRDIPLIRNLNLFGNNYSGAVQLPYTHPEDIAGAVASELQARGNGFEIKYIVSDVATGDHIASLFGQVIGKPELNWTEIPDEQLKQGMLGAGLTAELAGLITELGQGVRAGLITKDFIASGAKVTGKVKLSDFAEAFKNRYQQA